MDTKNTIKTLSQSLLDEVKKIMKKEKEEKSEKGESEADEKREHCSEALKGDQHKIDANKNGKVDAHDFKLLRKKKGVAEVYTSMKTSEEISEEEEVEEAVKEPYAVGMAAAMKATGDKPPLKKSTIMKAHKIAKKIKEEIDPDLEDELKAQRQTKKSVEDAKKKYTKEELDQVELTQEEIDRLDAMMADLDEARGRPPKEGSEAWKKRQEAGAAEQDEPRQHPIQQLERIKRDMRGGGDFKHKDGSTHRLTGGQAADLLDKYHGLKPAEKESMQRDIHANHAGLKKHL